MDIFKLHYEKEEDARQAAISCPLCKVEAEEREIPEPFAPPSYYEDHEDDFDDGLPIVTDDDTYLDEEEILEFEL